MSDAGIARAEEAVEGPSACAFERSRPLIRATLAGGAKSVAVAHRQSDCTRVRGLVTFDIGVRLRRWSRRRVGGDFGGGAHARVDEHVVHRACVDALRARSASA